MAIESHINSKVPLTKSVSCVFASAFYTLPASQIQRVLPPATLCVIKIFLLAYFLFFDSLLCSFYFRVSSGCVFRSVYVFCAFCLVFKLFYGPFYLN